jgi:hypothetical protein
MSETEYYIKRIMQDHYIKVEDMQYAKVYNDRFEIIMRKKNPILIIDKRRHPYTMYHDIKVAYTNIVLQSSC